MASVRTVTGVNNGGGKPLTGKEPWSAKTQCFCRDRTLPAIARVRVRSYSLKTLETAESFIHLCSSPSRHAPEILAYLYILTASAPDWLCCAVLCEMVTMDRSTAPSQGSEAHARGLPLLGAIHAAFLPEQGVPSAPAPPAPKGKCPAAQALIQTS